MAGTPSLTRMPRIQKEMQACLQCGYCIEVCEAHAQTPWESVTPRGKIYYLTQLDKKNVLDRLLNRKVNAKGDFVDVMYKCTGCGSCEEVCHAGLELVSLWEKIREWFVDNGLGPKPEHIKLVERISVERNPYGESQDERGDWWPDAVTRVEVPDVIMFAGCTGSFRMQHIPKAGVTVLDRAGVKQNCLGPDEICCTSPALRTGATTLTKRAADDVVNKADAIGAKDMVMTCAGCFKTVSTDFGNHYSMVGQNVYHFTQYVEKLIAERKLPLNNPINAKVTYHDPCHLGRHSKVFDAPRNILKKIKGIEFVEMERSREKSRCCGAGGGYKSAFNDLAVNVACERIKDAEEVGAQIIATACPFCVLNLGAGVKKLGSKVKVMDISEILLKVTAPVEAPPAPVAVPVPAPAPPAAVPVAAAPVSLPKDVEYVFDEETGMQEALYEEDGDVDGEEKPGDSGELKLRRRLWKRGYRYRRKYGKDKITIAYPKAKVAAFVDETGDRRICDGRLESAGWIVFRYKDADIADAKKESDEIIAAIERSLNAQEAAASPEYIYDDDTGQREIAFDDDTAVLGAETPQDSGELKLRRRLWRRGYRYRRKYGKERITIAFLRAKVAAFVDEIGESQACDTRLRNKGWIVFRYKDSSITDAKPEADEIIAALEKSLADQEAKAVSKDLEYIYDDETESKEAVYEEDGDVLKEETLQDSGELKLRRRLWRRGYRYRKKYGKDKITIAFLKAKVAAFVGDSTERHACDSKLENKGWVVFRYKDSDITDARPEADEIIAAIERSLRALETKEIPKDVEYIYDDETATEEPSYEYDEEVMAAELAHDSGELKLRRRLWRRGYRYRKKYGKDKITIAFLKAKVAAFVDETGESQACDTKLRNKGWTVFRYSDPSILDARPEADEIIAAIERNLSAIAVPKDDIDLEPAYEEDEDVLKDETAQDSGELKLRRRLWKRGYRYRKAYGREKITVAFLKPRVAVFVSHQITAKDKEKDDALRTAGWTVFRFRDASITDARREADKIIAAIERNLNALMNEEAGAKKGKGKIEIDEELFAEEKDDDPADLKLRRILWRNSYRYRRRYGREKITVAFRRAKVGAFVCADTYRRKGDDQLVKRGWTIMRFKESKVTDAKKEAEKVMAAVDRNLYLLSKGIIPEGANITSADVLDQEIEENTPEYRLRMALWKGHRYRRNFGEHSINIAYPAAKVAVFVGDSTERQPCDDILEADNWAVLRFKGANITDAKKEADKVVTAIEKNRDFLEELEFEGDDGEEEEDLSYLLEDTPEGRMRRAVWNKRIRYRRNYSRYKIDMAFVKFKVAVFVDNDGKGKPVDDTLAKKGWVVLRFKKGNITDGQEEANIVHKAVKERKKALKKKKKKPAAKKK